MAFSGDIFDATADRSADLTLDSLRRRMAAMHSLHHQAVASMELEHVNREIELVRGLVGLGGMTS